MARVVCLCLAATLLTSTTLAEYISMTFGDSASETILQLHAGSKYTMQKVDVHLLHLYFEIIESTKESFLLPIRDSTAYNHP